MPIICRCKLVLWLIVLFTLLSLTLSQSCRSYNRKSGKCIPISSCPPLIQILKGTPSLKEIRVLQRLTCGFENEEPKVCCAENDIKVVPTCGRKCHKNFKLLPSLQECSVAISHDRIIGGEEVELGEYPQIVRLGYKNPDSDGLEYYCAGTIINKRYILTASHCTQGLDEENALVLVRAGEHDAESISDCSPGLGLCSQTVDYKIEKIIGHKNYSSSTKHNDISLIRVDRDISFNSYWVKPICLPFYEENGLPTQDYSKMIAVGWGRTQWNKAEGSRVLKQVQLPEKANSECQSIYGRRIQLIPKQLCAGGEAGKDTCGGDSGGPLMQAKPTKFGSKFFQIGIVSIGPVQCGIGNLPGIYTKISSYLDWILDNIEA